MIIKFGARARALIFVLLFLSLLLVLAHFRRRDEPRLEPLDSVTVPVAPGNGPLPSVKPAPDSATNITDKQWSSVWSRVPCVGLRGLNFDEENDDTLRESVIEGLDYPSPFVGSHDTVGLSQTWMTAAARYGPYGWGDDQAAYDGKKAPWNETDWAKLQNQCIYYNAHGFHDAAIIQPFARRFRMREPGEEIKSPVIEPQAANYVPRTAIVLRAWEGYNYTAEDLVNLRATVAETALRFGGEYTVYILVHVKDTGRNIFSSDENYRRAVEDLVPPEFWGMAVLFDETLLQSWYPEIKTHGATYQIMQPLQLFAHFYPKFDFYWQLELDVRFTGHAGRYLTALSDFAREQPRKQAIERSTWYYMPEFHGGYSDLLAAVNASLEGKGGLGWGMRIQDFEPIGPKPPVEDPLDDNFEWGVGDEADFIALTPCAYMPSLEHWVWRNWQQGLKAGTKTPGWMCQPAMGRASRTLLLAVHHAQAVQGLAMHSEATLSSFALWHGLKLVVPPQPIYQDPQWPHDKMNELFNGPGAIETHRMQGMEGMARGDVIYRQTDYEYITTTSASFWYTSDFPNRIYDAWLGRVGSQDGSSSRGVPYVLWRSGDGKVYAPNMMLHPVKTNQNRPLDSSGDSPWLVIAGVAVSLLGLSAAGFWWWKRSSRSRYSALRTEEVG
ncbi:hypothetical protein N657DRAFT_699833 [Parathielavia appendiculata]|uniref:Uncharacterized protein n=1 Tax=Parathielavia appendiculata TaxID=2587402 RepID=A0AAN6TVF2_9PEZI|nr:hypothetical protein N657DRAFT_699833 [Parathielavia appendiculata]